MTMTMHPAVQSAYSEVHRWLERRDDTAGYMKIDERKISKRLACEDMKHIAAQFGILFPAHYFKCLFTFEQILRREMLLGRLRYNPHVAFIDVGCGAGAATAAFLSVVDDLQRHTSLPGGIKVACIGVEPVGNALGIYFQFLCRLRKHFDSTAIDLEIRVVDRPVSESVTDLDTHLGGLLREWMQPALSHVFLAQSNIVLPLGRLYADQESRRKLLEGLGIPRQAYVNEDRFGTREARSYRQLLSQVSIDNLYTITIGTDQEELLKRVKTMGASIAEVFARHKPILLAKGTETIAFYNPDDSYWKIARNIEKAEKKRFGVDVRSMRNAGLDGDLDWHRVIKPENLELAWARARAILQREVLYDEIEIRLFERNLKANLKRLHRELLSYDPDVARTGDRIQFGFVKNANESRPRVMSRIEEEIVSIAIVQELGAAAFGLNSTSYAYRPNPRFASRSEFLYEYWFSSWQRYKDDVRNSVAKHSDCKVLSIDIKSYYTGIPQERLVESVEREIRSRSARIRWLLERMLCVNLDEDHVGFGLSQGGAGSGFYANTYLTDFDSKFGINNDWGAHIFRFVDDIVIVIPDANNLTAVKRIATETLDDLGLKLNEKKTEEFYQSDYLNLPQDKGKMNGLSERFDRVVKPLWRTNGDIRVQLAEGPNWWHLVGQYRDHLRSIGHYIEPHRLSRKLYQYVEKYRAKGDGRDGQSDLTLLPIGDPKWEVEFKASNVDLIECRDALRQELTNLAKKSYSELDSEACKRRERLLSTRVYFSVNRIARLGFGDAAGFVSEILLNKPWVIRQPQYIVRGLAIQGFGQDIQILFDHYSKCDSPWASSFLAVILRAIRHLDEVPQSLEDGVMQIALQQESDPVLRLMASETWLMKLDSQRIVEHEAAIRTIAVSHESARVRKNYLLLLGKCKRIRREDYREDDPLLIRAMEIAVDETVDTLFDYEEPGILRERYYSSFYPEFYGEYGHDGYY